MHKVYALLCTLLMGVTAFAADPEPFLKSAPMPFYPPLARQARVEGKVVLRVTINQAGESSVEGLSGPALLRDATVEYVKEWKVGWPHLCACTVSREVTFVYKILMPEATPDSPIATVRWFGMSRVEIDSAPPHLEMQVSY
jgi:TonB family protein